MFRSYISKGVDHIFCSSMLLKPSGNHYFHRNPQLSQCAGASHTHIASTAHRSPPEKHNCNSPTPTPQTFTYNLTPTEHPHGFRKVHSTTTALSAINSERTVLVALDLFKAFDIVFHSTLSCFFTTRSWRQVGRSGGSCRHATTHHSRQPQYAFGCR